MNERWPHQQAAFEQTIAAIVGRECRICVTSPTGSGKTRMMIDVIEWAAENSMAVALYTNRKTLCGQIKSVLESHGIYPGMRAAGYDRALLRPVQLCMTQTESSQVFSRQSRELHEADIVLIDEAHLQKGEAMARIMQYHEAHGAANVGYTATPLDLDDLYTKLIVAARMSDCIKCKAIVPAHTYAPDEPDLRHIKRYPVGQDLTEADNAKVMMRPGIFGRVHEHWKRLNPDALPTILFAPGVKESIWFAEQFHSQGVRAAHIDGSDVWLDGEFIADDTDAREFVIDLVRRGDVPIICNRFVLREGIDIPELRHGILATVFGSLSSYIQSCGRLLRACDEKQYATIQDHGGAWWRHGSVNVDREWSLAMTNHRAVGERHEQMREKKEREPVVCPKCSRAYMPDLGACPACGVLFRGKSRMVVQINGDLKAVSGDVLRPRTVKQQPDTAKRWERYYYSQRRAGRTFNQAYAWFFHEEHYWPPKSLPLMPVEPGDWFAKIQDVPHERLQAGRKDVA